MKSEFDQEQLVDGFETGVHGRVEKALASLWRAYCYSAKSSRDVWDFAVEISSLRKAGLDNSDLRWMVCAGLVEHAREVAMHGGQGRAFHPSAHLTFSPRTCFILSEQGIHQASRMFGRSIEPEPMANEAIAPQRNLMVVGDSPIADIKPVWDRDRQELSVGGVIVKAFKLPSPNQETIINAFDEEGWPTRIDDPLAPRGDVDPKRRLHDTIKSLNRNQKNRMLRFTGDGTGEGIRWELFKPAEIEQRLRQA